MIEKIEKRIKDIETALQQTAVQHATLLGHLEEAKNFLKMAEELPDKTDKTDNKATTQAADPTATTVS